MRLFRALTATLLVAVVTAAAVAAVAALALPRYPLDLLGALCIVAIGATGFAAVLDRLGVAPERARWLGVIIGLGLAVLLPRYGLAGVDAFLVADRPASWLGGLLGSPRLASTALVIAAGGVVVWRAGLRFGSQDRLTPSAARGLAARAVATLAAVAVVNVWVPPIDLGPYWLGALVTGLALLALAEIRDPDGGAVRTRHRSWSFLLVGVIALVAVLALVLTGILSAATALGAWDQAVTSAYDLAVNLFLLIAYLVLTPFEGLLNWLRSLLSQQPVKPPKPIEDPLAQWRALEEGQTLLDLAWVKFAIEIALAILLIWLAVRWIRSALAPPDAVDPAPAEERQSELSAGRLAADARQAAALLARRLAEAFTGGRGSLTGARRIYADLLRLMADRGHARASDQTPLEYLAVAQAEIPGAATELADLTDAYVEERYGERALGAERLAGLAAGWGRIRGAGDGGRRGTG